MKRDIERLADMLEGHLCESADGELVGLYAVSNLRWQNPFGDRDVETLVREIAAHGPSGLLGLAHAILEELSRKGPAVDAEGRERHAGIASRLAIEGHILGLGAPWGTCPTSYLLWAALAHVCEFYGVDHPGALLRGLVDDGA